MATRKKNTSKNNERTTGLLTTVAKRTATANKKAMAKTKKRK